GFLISSVIGIEFSPHPVQSEVAVPSEFLKNLNDIVYIYNNYLALNLSTKLKAELNYQFWSALAMMTRSNALVYADDLQGADFSNLANSKSDLTAENLKKAIGISLPYFNKAHIQREIRDLLSHSDFDLSNKKTTCKAMLLSSQQRGTANMLGFMNYKHTIPILYRAYLISVEINPNENEAKKLTTVLYQPVYRRRSSDHGSL